MIIVSVCVQRDIIVMITIIMIDGIRIITEDIIMIDIHVDGKKIKWT